MYSGTVGVEVSLNPSTCDRLIESHCLDEMGDMEIVLALTHNNNLETACDLVYSFSIQARRVLLCDP